MWNVIAVTSWPYVYKNPAHFCQFSFPFTTSSCADQVNHHRSHRCCHCLRLYQHQIHCILVVMPPKRSGANPESILYKTISGRYRAYPDGLKTARYRCTCKKNASWEKNCMKPIFTMLRASELFIVLGNLEKQMCIMSEISNPNDELLRKQPVFIPQLVWLYCRLSGLRKNCVRTTKSYYKRVNLTKNLLRTFRTV